MAILEYFQFRRCFVYEPIRVVNHMQLIFLALLDAFTESRFKTYTHDLFRRFVHFGSR